MPAMLSVALGASPAAAADARHGGDLVVCPTESGREPRFWDALETEARRGWELSLPTEAPDADAPLAAWIDAARAVLARFATLDPTRATRWQARASALSDDVRMVDAAPFPRVSDGDIVGLPAGCRLEQMAWIKPRQRPQERIFFVLRGAWERLPPVDRVVALVHLIAYEEMIAFGAGSNDDARLITSLVVADRLSRFSFAEYLRLWERFDLDDFPISLYGSCVRYRTREMVGDQLQQAWFCAPSQHQTRHGTVELAGDQRLEMHRSGTVKGGILGRDFDAAFGPWMLTFPAGFQLALRDDGKLSSFDGPRIGARHRQQPDAALSLGGASSQVMRMLSQCEMLVGAPYPRGGIWVHPYYAVQVTIRGATEAFSAAFGFAPGDEVAISEDGGMRRMETPSREPGVIDVCH